jgi:hypothetical protein
MLAFLAAAQNASGALPNDAARAARRARWAAARDELTNATNGYATNMLHAKIESPVDDNFSDDQLTFLPYYSLLVAGGADSDGSGGSDSSGSDSSGSGAPPSDRAAGLASLERTWAAARPGRSDLWAAVYMACTGARPAADVASMLWTLRAWPLELVNWNTSSAQRRDLAYQRDGSRFLRQQQLGPSPFTSRVLPANERSQYLWNVDPFDTRAVQDWNNEPARRHDGMDEEDPGAWLLPYWLARHHGLIAAA